MIDHRPPTFTARDASSLARAHWGIEAEASPLPSERDQNFLLTGAAGERHVLKLAEAGEERAFLECQNAAMRALASAGTRFRFPLPLATRSDAEIVELPADGGVRHFARVVAYVPGDPLALARPQSSALLRDVGVLVGSVDRVLAGFAHPATARAFHWDLRQASAVIASRGAHAVDARDRALVDGFAPVLVALDRLDGVLRESVIHGDANDYNVLVRRANRSAPAMAPAAIGLVDFGDMVRSWTVADLAIACAYCMLGKRDPLAAAAHVVAGYHEANALDDDELAALFPLIHARLCTSLLLAGQQQPLRPENEYLSISAEPVRTLLAQLAGVNAAHAEAVFRAATGRAAVPRSLAVVRWIDANAGDFAPVLPTLGPLRDAPVLDLAVDSTLADGGDPADPATWRASIGRTVRANPGRCAIGRYGETRAWYTNEAFRVSADDADAWRTVHLGIAVFAPPGTPAHSPLAGRVHVATGSGARDRDGAVLLHHEPADGPAFFTLYRGLEAGAAVRAGDEVERGALLGTIGDGAGDHSERPAGLPSDERDDGAWPPHVHVQLIVDLLAHDAAFPGAAQPAGAGFWRSVSPDPHTLLGLPPCSAPPPPRPDALLARRSATIGPSLSVAYRKPLVIVRGWRQHLYDADGQRYLDAVNNVAHVGHCHPRVTAALRDQSGVLNTNTRYLHELLELYAERLTATLPEPLRVCYFVCSGSEANELALRLARAHTRRRDVIVLDGAYHGNTTSLIELSPYKYAGPGGEGRAPHVHVAPLPDPYRGRYRGGPEAGRRYADDVRALAEQLVRAGRAPGAFFAEALPGCGGQIVPPDGFLAAAFAHVRATGGVCVADEVQTGLGRVGSHFWAFETQAAVPDIVTVGKPIGNGYPLGAVITTPEIARSFANGMEYFNTFGGNPVSCAVGLAVLDVIEQEGLQANALRVGTHLLEGLHTLSSCHDIIGDVRGLGLYMGVELVLDRNARTPAGEVAAHVANRMRERGILVSTDGPDGNVLKIKPPMVFAVADADGLVDTLDEVLSEDAARAGS